ncbi:hypothetical protein G7072_11485 [Nocardioides sp. HDW12B]|uniref:hypothetical protein n=1 Tax=Nocardioides sp. HDW12B TaxID=2714939 RepID=UPI001408528B|nr:hypothetical protein [Nocardioides sp. HDW12B]QIK66883.1 hypothetical protein G7072_11485 [Nocardioides sp. HDW12B]
MNAVQKVVAGVVTLVVGIGLGGCSGGNEAATPAPPAKPSTDSRHAASPRGPSSGSSVRERDERPAQLLPDGRPAAVDPDLVRLATSFVAYAVGDARTFPHAVTISLSLGGEAAGTLDDLSQALSTRRTWRSCPPGWTTYGAGSCPVDSLAQITNAEANGRTLVLTPRVGAVTCAPTRTGPVPSGRRVVLRPSLGDRTCANDFALVLAADRHGRLRAVDLTIAEP